jgi:hypothetical protein
VMNQVDMWLFPSAGCGSHSPANRLSLSAWQCLVFQVIAESQCSGGKHPARSPYGEGRQACRQL